MKEMLTSTKEIPQHGAGSACVVLKTRLQPCLNKLCKAGALLQERRRRSLRRAGRETFTPRSETFIPRSETFTPRSETFIPRSKTYIPRSKTFIPRSETFIPRSKTFIPRSKTFIPWSKPTYLPDTIPHPRSRVYSLTAVCSTDNYIFNVII
jgi:hypothetical protein